MSESRIVPYSCVRHLSAGSALVLAPHPDDEVLGCGGAILRHVEAGEKVDVVIFTDGAAAAGAADFQSDYVEMRKSEARDAARVLGYGEPAFLDYPDRGLAYDEALVARISSLITVHKPAIVYAPSLYEIHPDHRALAMATVEAMRRLGGPLCIALYEIGNPQMPNRLLDATDLTETLKRAMLCYPSQLTQQRYDLHVLEGLNRFRAYTLAAGITAAEGYWLATGDELRQRRPGFCDLLLSSWADAGIGPSGEPPVVSQTPLVSIVTRTIGRDSLPDTLASIAAQIWPNIEVVLVEASSAARGAGENSGFWRYPLRAVGGGQSLARPEAGNLGLAHAHGEFILFLDDDDCIDPDHVASLARLLSENPAAVAAYSGVRVLTSRDPQSADSAVYHEPFNAWQLAHDNYLPVHGVMFRRSVVEKGCAMDPTLPLYEDWDFWLQVSRLGPFLRSDQVTATYFSTGSSGAGALDFDPQIARQARMAIYRKWLALWEPAEIDHILGLNRATRKQVAELAGQNDRLAQDAADLSRQLAALETEITSLRAARQADATAPHAPNGTLEIEPMLAELLPAPARILAVGSGNGRLLAELLRRGYDAVGLVPDLPSGMQIGAEVDAAQIVSADYASFRPEGALFDAILFHDSARHLDPLLILDRAMDLLVPGGKIVVKDAFALARHSWSPEPLHLLGSFRAMGQRLSFSVVAERDLDQDSPAALTGGLHGYRLLSLRWDHDPGWRLRPVKLDSYPQFAALFRETFGHDMSLDHWEWKYAEGRSENIGVWEGGELIAHYGGISRAGLAFGHPTLLALPGDVMARKGAHRGLGRRSAFFAAAATMQELHLGLGTRHLISAGFPNDHHAGRAARILGLYGEPADRVLELRWPAATSPEPLRIERIEPAHHARAKDIVDALWQDMAHDLADEIVAIRDWDSLSYRFLEHPDRKYDLHLICDETGAPLGAIVLRRVGDDIELLDVIGKLANMPRMVAAARDIAAREDASSLWGWFTEHCALPRLATPDAVTRDIKVETPNYAWSEGLALEKIKGRIWLTAADADFH